MNGQRSGFDPLGPRDVDEPFPVVFLPGSKGVGIIQGPPVQVNAADGDARGLASIRRAIQVGPPRPELDERKQRGEAGVGAPWCLPGDEKQRALAACPRLEQEPFGSEAVECRTAVGRDHPLADRDDGFTGSGRLCLGAHGDPMAAERGQVAGEIARTVLDVRRLRGVDGNRDPLERHGLLAGRARKRGRWRRECHGKRGEECQRTPDAGRPLRPSRCGAPRGETQNSSRSANCISRLSRRVLVTWPKSGLPNSVTGSPMIEVIEGVERLDSELEPHAIGDRHVLHERQVDRVDPGAGHRADACVAERVGRRRSEGVGVEELLDCLRTGIQGRRPGPAASRLPRHSGCRMAASPSAAGRSAPSRCRPAASRE